MKIFFFLFLFFISLNASSEGTGIKKYQQMLLDNAENLNGYPEGQVYLEIREEDTLFPQISDSFSIPCNGRSETKKTILVSGIDDDGHFGQDMDERYYLLEEKSFYLDASSINFSPCLEHYGKEIIEVKNITLLKKNRISLREFKRLFNQKIYKANPLGKERINIIRQATIIQDDAIYCGPIFWGREGAKTNPSRKEDMFMPIGVIQNLSRTWEFAEEKIYNITSKKVELTRKRLPNIDPRTLDNQIMDVEVDLGSYSYLLTGGCKKEEIFPKKKWREIINWRPPWPGGRGR
jgi:hypothetical protein